MAIPSKKLTRQALKVPLEVVTEFLNVTRCTIIVATAIKRWLMSACLTIRDAKWSNRDLAALVVPRKTAMSLETCKRRKLISSTKSGTQWLTGSVSTIRIIALATLAMIADRITVALMSMVASHSATKGKRLVALTMEGEDTLSHKMLALSMHLYRGITED